MGQDRGKGGAGPAGQGADAGHQFGDVERLGQVVISAYPQAFDLVLDGGRGGQHQYPGAVPAGGYLAADLVAVDAGQVPVQHDHVIPVDGGLGERVAAVEGHVDGHALTAQYGRYRQRQLGVVLDHQHPHRSSSAAGVVCSPGLPRERALVSLACLASDNSGVTALPPGYGLRRTTTL